MFKYCAIAVNGLFAIVLIASASAAFSQSRSEKVSPEDAKRLERFEKQVDDLRGRLKVPGLSVAVVKEQKLIWAKGFGYADLEKKIPATPDTLYHLASITKTFGATLIMQLVEQGKLSLDEPASRYSPNFKDDSVKIKHLISHTAAGTPGERYQYDGSNFDHLDAVIEKKFGKTFTQLAVETFFDPLGMSHSVPYHNVVVDSGKWMASLGKERLDRYKKNLEAFAQPYAYYGDGEMVLDSYPGRHYNGSAASLLSTVLDMAKYDMAIDRHLFLKKETQEKAWTPFISNDGKRLPYGFGWFVTDYQDQKLIWHYGHWGTGFSTIYLKVPAKNVSLIMLANSESLVDHQFQANGDITENAFVCSFLAEFVLSDQKACEQTARSAVTKWLEDRRKKGRTAIPVDPKILETYIGRYQFETLGDRIYTVTREGDKLFIQSTGGSKFEVLPESPTTFFLKTRPYVFVFTTSAGKPAEMKIVEGSNTYLSKRLN